MHAWKEEISHDKAKKKKKQKIIIKKLYAASFSALRPAAQSHQIHQSFGALPRGQGTSWAVFSPICFLQESLSWNKALSQVRKKIHDKTSPLHKENRLKMSLLLHSQEWQVRASSYQPSTVKLWFPEDLPGEIAVLTVDVVATLILNIFCKGVAKASG